MIIRKASSVDLIDRILDKGIVIEYHGDVSVGGIDTLITVDARYVVSSIETHFAYGDRVIDTPPGVLMSRVRQRPRR